MPGCWPRLGQWHALVPGVMISAVAQRPACVHSAALPGEQGRELFRLAKPARNYSSKYKGQIESLWLLWDGRQ